MINVYCGGYRSTKLECDGKFCHPQKSFFGQNWPQIHILQPNGMKHRFLDLKIINYRHCYPRNDLLQYLKLLFSPSNIFSHFWQ